MNRHLEDLLAGYRGLALRVLEPELQPGELANVLDLQTQLFRAAREADALDWYDAQVGEVTAAIREMAAERRPAPAPEWYAQYDDGYPVGARQTP